MRALLFLTFSPSLLLSLINNRKPEANYVIPIYVNETAIVHCVSFFARTIFQRVNASGQNLRLPCVPCRLDHVQYSCCTKVNWHQLDGDRNLRLRCTSECPKWAEDDPNIPYIDISVVRRDSGPMGGRTDTVYERTVAYSDEVYYCNHKSNLTHLTAGSHIGLGWTSEQYEGVDPPAEPSTPATSYTESGRSPPALADHMSDDAKSKEELFRSHYANSAFNPLWTSLDEKVELKPHESEFSCNETDYVLPIGSPCMTPSSNAIFVMTNCGLVEQIFIVIGVIILLIIAYIVFNVLVWLWDYAWHRSYKNDDDDLIVFS